MNDGRLDKDWHYYQDDVISDIMSQMQIRHVDKKHHLTQIMTYMRTILQNYDRSLSDVLVRMWGILQLQKDLKGSIFVKKIKIRLRWQLRLTLVLVGVGVGVAGGLPALPAEEAVQVGPGLVGAALLHSVALGALLHEDLLALGDVTHDDVWRRKSWLETWKLKEENIDCCSRKCLRKSRTLFFLNSPKR